MTLYILVPCRERSPMAVASEYCLPYMPSGDTPQPQALSLPGGWHGSVVDTACGGLVGWSLGLLAL